MTLRVEPMTREGVAEALDDIAALRIAIFAKFPYLYDGDLDYERAYLRPYCDSADAIVVGVWDGAELVGASTGMPMRDHDDAFGAAFAKIDYAVADLFYCAESVLLPQYRGQGIGKAFFAHREARARQLGLRYSTFCGVVRPADHPDRPADYKPLDPFWRAQGYCDLPGIVAEFSWKDHGMPAETTKTLQFWIKDLEETRG